MFLDRLQLPYEKADYRMFRRDVHMLSDHKLAERILGNPKPTVGELSLGCFEEELELQVREAVIEFNVGGYVTCCSGFAHDENIQFIHGPFYLDKATRARLDELRKNNFPSLDISMDGRKWTEISFAPVELHVEHIMRQWKKITDQLTYHEYRAPFSDKWVSEEFRYKYGPGAEQVEIMRLKRLLASKRAPRWHKRWKRRVRYLHAKIAKQKNAA